MQNVESSVSRSALRRIGLVFVTDQEPGISRARHGKGFRYTLPDGSALRDKDDRRRVVSLGIPPAYEDVWICPSPVGHLQATGLDSRGRKQYRYHPDWTAWRNEVKFSELAAFADALPRIRRRMRKDLKSTPDDRMFVLAALTALLDATHMRVGNRAYARENKTYGATTLLKRHLSLSREGIKLRFTAKGGKRVSRRLKDKRLQRILEEISDLPGRHVFGYADDDGSIRAVDSGQLNAYLQDISGHAFTAKTFRTWGGTLAAFEAGIRSLAGETRPTMKSMCVAASGVLHNTPTICRSSYVHPAVLNLSKLENVVERQKVLDVISVARPKDGLRAQEARLKSLLLAADALELA